MDVGFSAHGQAVERLRRYAGVWTAALANLVDHMPVEGGAALAAEQSFTPPAELRPAAGDERRNGLRCILVHGFNGEPIDMTELEGHLRALGFATRNLLLPGHGTNMRDFAEHGWGDWYGTVLEATRDALERGERVLLIGHSMGASASLAVAAEEPRVEGVVAMCPPLNLHPIIAPAVARLGRVFPYFPSWREDIRDRRGARVRYARNAYTWTAVSTLQSLLAALPHIQQALPNVMCPALVISARNDHVVPLRDGLLAYQLLGSDEKELMVLRESYHAVTKDVERHLVFDRVLRFCYRVHTGANV